MPRAGARPRPFGTTPLAAAVLLTACGDDPLGPVRRGIGLSEMRAVTPVGGSDTVLAPRTWTLTVQVKNESGQLARGTVVTFESLATADTARRYQRGVLVCAAEVSDCGLASGPPNSPGPFRIVDTTDASGRASAKVRLGTVAGPAMLEVRVPPLRLHDTARFTVLPGRAVRMGFIVKDSAGYAGASWSVGGAAMDRFENRRSDPVTYSAGPGTTTDAGGRLTLTETGRRLFVVARSGALADTAWASVVPRGTIAASSSGGPARGVYVIELDGTGRRRLAELNYDNGENAAPSWTPAGDRVAFGDGPYIRPSLHTVTLAGDRQPLPTPGTVSATWPRYSPNGEWVYFQALHPVSAHLTLWRVPASGSASAAELVSPSPTTVEFRPAPSPDGARLAYVFSAGYGPLIRVRTLATGAVSALDVFGESPRWSPAGDRIAYTVVSTSGTWGPMAVMAPDGSARRQITPAGSKYGPGFDWSPDGRWIITRGIGQIDLIEVSTGTVLPLAFTRALGQPSWRPSTAGAGR